jgi:hypothetical protein
MKKVTPACRMKDVEEAGFLAGKISGPAIISTDLRRMTVVPSGDVTMTATAEAADRTWDGRLAAWLTDGGTYADCVAQDHRLRIALPRTA